MKTIARALELLRRPETGAALLGVVLAAGTMVALYDDSFVFTWLWRDVASVLEIGAVIGFALLGLYWSVSVLRSQTQPDDKPPGEQQEIHRQRAEDGCIVAHRSAHD